MFSWLVTESLVSSRKLIKQMFVLKSKTLKCKGNKQIWVTPLLYKKIVQINCDFQQTVSFYIYYYIL